jgi:serine/threonine protein phosphatase PrpC
VISEPDVIQRRITQDDCFLILACDGLWKELPVLDAVEHVWNHLKACEMPFSHIQQINNNNKPKISQ